MGMEVEASKEHHWLKQFIGNWVQEFECPNEPGKPPMKFRGTESVRAVGDLWIIGDGEGEMPGGGAAHMILTLGYDPMKQRYVGSWIGSMMFNLWVYEGSVDASGRVLTLDTVGPVHGNPEKTAQYRDIHEFTADGRRLFRSEMRGDDGKWTQLVSGVYTRTK